MLPSGFCHSLFQHRIISHLPIPARDVTHFILLDSIIVRTSVKRINHEALHYIYYILLQFLLFGTPIFYSSFCFPRHLKLTRHTDIKFKRQKDGHFRRVTSQSWLPIFFFFCYWEKVYTAI